MQTTLSEMRIRKVYCYNQCYYYYYYYCYYYVPHRTVKRKARLRNVGCGNWGGGVQLPAHTGDVCFL